MEQNRAQRLNTHRPQRQPVNLPQRGQEHKFLRSSLRTNGVGKLDSRTPNNETRPLSDTMHKNQPQMDRRLEC